MKLTRSPLALGALLILAACVPAGTTIVGDQEVFAVEATYLKAPTFVPAPEHPDGYVMGLMFHDIVSEALARFEAPGQARPTIVYLHGCSGFVANAVWNLGARYAKLNYVFIAPNSYARPGRRNGCKSADDLGRGDLLMREQELRHAREQIAKQRWARQSHVYLMGFSEGAAATAYTSNRAFCGRIILGNKCQHGPMRGDRSQPALVLVADKDPKLPRGMNCRVGDHPASASRSISSYSHDITSDLLVLTAIDHFLATTLSH